MRANTFRRIASDLSTLHEALPPNYLWPANDNDQDQLLSLDVLLVGPSHTPYSEGLWRLHFDIPPDYPQQPPTANFRTPIFHPNVDQQTGSICVETLKRDWTSTLTLRDLLITITCLLIQPNPDSALNAEAGALIQENYELFARRATLLASIHAVIPRSLCTAAREAQLRGHAQPEAAIQPVEQCISLTPASARRQRRPTVHRPHRVAPRRSDGSPTAAMSRRREVSSMDHMSPASIESDCSFERMQKARQLDTMVDDQENELSLQPQRPSATPSRSTPRRPPGPPIPLGEMLIDSESSHDEMEMEYPPSPRKSPRKAAPQTQPAPWSNLRPHPLDITRENHALLTPLQSFEHSFSSTTRLTSPKGKERCYDDQHVVESQVVSEDVFPQPVNTSPALDHSRLWDLCRHDIQRWNRGEFDHHPFPLVASRW